MDAHPAPAALSALRVGLAALLVALFVRTFVVQLVMVSSGSMEPTLLPGDTVLVDRLAFAGHSLSTLPARAPRRGDVVVFRRAGESEPLLVKRCVALEGDRVEIDGSRGVWVNGMVAPGASPATSREAANALARSPAAWSIPTDALFLVGDHRFASRDSRDFGPVPAPALVGRVIGVLWSVDPVTHRWRATRTARPVR